MGALTATLRNLELLGEAASHISDEICVEHSNIQWCSIMGTRNRVPHGYLGLDNDTLWDIIQNDIPDLLPELRSLLDTAS